ALVDHLLLEERPLDREHLLRLFTKVFLLRDDLALVIERDARRERRGRPLAEGGERLLDLAEDDAVPDAHLEPLELRPRELRLDALESARHGDGRTGSRLAGASVAPRVLDERPERLGAPRHVDGEPDETFGEHRLERARLGV